MKKEQWDDHDWDGEDIVKIVELNGTGNASELKIFINMDANSLIEYLRNNRIMVDTRIAAISEIYKIGILIYRLVSYLELKEKFGEESVPVDEIVATSMKGVARTLLDLQINEQIVKMMANE
ncbi:MAG: hypothetical protein QG657_1621 [Acidobacteriota bacterium]|nr:hypothetical protein [Planctomycetota bacterium]MDQ1276413.1 hypothetical protein [Euryarchaeota archaeon]MDQ1351319.1 hypothetical protein [Acidobacteriota bacterium]